MAITATCLLLVGIAACGSDDDDDDVGAGTDTTVEQDDANQATGEPVKVGFINLEAPALNQEQIRFGAEAAVEYLNAELGGLDGRPIELVVCKTLATPESSSACANQMIEDEVVAVVLGSDAFRTQVVPTVTAAGIPYVVISASDVIEQESSPVFIFTPGLIAIYSASAEHAKAEGWTDFVMFVTDVPSAVQPVETLAVPAFREAGVNLKVVRVPRDLADATPFVSDAMRDDPQGYLIVGSTPQCISLMNAVMASGKDIQQLAIQQCLSADVFEAIGEDNLTGTLLLGAFYAGEDTDEGALYHEKLETYGADDVDPAGLAAQGWATLLTLARVANEGGISAADITSESLIAAMKAAKDVPLALGVDETITCDGNQLEGFSNVCSNAAFLAEVVSATERKLVDKLEV